MANFHLILSVCAMFVCAIDAITNVKHALGCENSQVELTCGHSKVVEILEANYGRTSGSICMQGPIHNVTCYRRNTIEILTEICEEKSFCTLSASNGIFGDPCPGTLKYLFVLYQCVQGKNNKHAVACENSSAKLHCRPGKLIKILDANYGRRSGLTCTNGPIKTVNCRSRNSASVVSQMCNNKMDCEVSATNNIFGDPCFGTHKYLYIKYKCVKERRYDSSNHPFHLEKSTFTCRDGTRLPTTAECDGIKDCPSGEDEMSCSYDSKIACENDRLEIKCKNNKILNIINANYGRLTTNICPSGTMSKNINCRNENSLDAVYNKCQGKQKCSIKAENKVFGDTCEFTVKYLEVYYTCEEEYGPHVINPRSV